MVNDTPQDPSISWGRVRQQFDAAPYPRMPLEKSPKDDRGYLYKHSFVTAYYRCYGRVPTTEGKLILDAGCGSGYKSLALAIANPGAKIIGIDLSAKSVELARKRLEYHGIQNCDFHVLALENLPDLGLQFDYINCDEVLYLLPDAIAGLRSLKIALKPEGILRANLHSTYQRANFYRAQRLFQGMDLLDEEDKDLAVETAREIMKALKNDVPLKQTTWSAQIEASEEDILANHLLREDKGFTIPQLFDTLRSSALNFVSMTDSGTWKLESLFAEPDNLPPFLAMSLPGLSEEEKLTTFELLQPNHRLLDFWSTRLENNTNTRSLEDWTESNWYEARVFLHPLLCIPEAKAELASCLQDPRPFCMSRYLPVPGYTNVTVDSTMAASLFPLFEGPQTVRNLAKRWHQVHPVDAISLDPLPETTALFLLRKTFQPLERFGYLLLADATS